MPTLKYWDGSAYVPAPAVPGPTGIPGYQGPDGPTGPPATVPTDDVGPIWLGWTEGVAPPAGTRLRLYTNSFVVTADVFSCAWLTLPRPFTYGYNAFATMGDGSPSPCMGVTIYKAQCALNQVVCLVWRVNPNSAPQNVAVRVNLVVIGA